MMAKPTAASAAATTITKNTKMCAFKSPSMYPKATKLRFTALSINSMDMNTVTMLRFSRNPATPSTNRTALNIRYQLTGIIRPPLAQHHRAHDGHQDQHRGDFEGQQKFAEQQFAYLARVIAGEQRGVHQV